MEAAKPLDLGWHLDVAWAEGMGGGGGRRIKCWSEEDRERLRRTGGESALLCCGVVRSTAHMANGKAQRLSWKFKL